MKFKIDKKLKGIIGIAGAVIAALMTFNEARNTQIMEDELDDLKEKVAKLEGKES